MRALAEPSLFRHQALIDGRWCAADSGEVVDILDPGTNERLGPVPVMGAAEAIRAVDSNERAMGPWKRMSAAARARLLQGWYRRIVEHEKDLVCILTAEQGKPIGEALGEIRYAASYVEWFAEEGKRAYGDVIPSSGAERRLLVLRQPIGICAAITPWNFPAAMVTRKVAPALAAGCVMTLKPAPQTPFTALALAWLALEAGIPPGVFNVVPGDADAIGKVLTGDRRVRKLSFTGSTPVGRLLMRQCAEGIKKVSLELGGNAPFIVLEDADLDAAVSGCIASKFRNSGQTCVCANRIFVQDSVHDEFVQRLVAAVCKLRVGNGFEPGTEIGPLVNAAALEKVEAHVADAIAQGAQVEIGGSRHALGGNFYQPTVLSACTTDMRLSHEETFGPIAPLFRFQSVADAVKLANETESGLAAYLYGRDLERIWMTAEALEFGIVGINTGIISAEQAPFGGIKQSGIGREGSRYGLDEYLEMKYLCMKLGSA